MISPDTKCGNKKQKNDHDVLVRNPDTEGEKEVNKKEHGERCANMIGIIKAVAATIECKISTQEEWQIKSWDMIKLRKKLGYINVCKKEYQSRNNIKKNKHDHDTTTFQRCDNV